MVMPPGDELGKLFVGGLSWDTNQDSLLRYFSRYGEVIDCVVMKNQTTGKSRGFGFVTYKEPGCLETVLAQQPHVLDGRQIDPKACNPRSMNKLNKQAAMEAKARKIFVGGLPPNCDEKMLKEFFEQFGKVTEASVMYDQQKQRSRGFGFLSFESEEAVERVVAQHYVVITGKQVECKRAEPRDGPAPPKSATPTGMTIATLRPVGPDSRTAAVMTPNLTSALQPLTPTIGLQPPTFQPPAFQGQSFHQWPQNAGMWITTAALPAYSGGQSVAGTIPSSSTSASSTQDDPSPTTSVTPITMKAAEAAALNSYHAAATAAYPPTAYGEYIIQQQQAGLMGSYPQEASSYGPARGFVSADGTITSTLTPSSLAYAVQTQQAAVEASSHYTCATLPTAYAGQTDAAAALYGLPAAMAAGYGRGVFNHTAAAAAFHPYRR